MRGYRCGWTAIAATVIMALAAGVGGARPAGAAGQAVPSASTSFSTPGNLTDVAATSATNAWAIGDLSNSKTELDTPIVAHWNGTKWSRVTIPHVHSAMLDAVAAVSPSDAWIVGFDEDPVTPGNYETALVLHWNGHTWTRVLKPLFAGDVPGDVAATAKSVWVFGQDQIWHLAGGTWSLLPASLPLNGTTYPSVGVAWPATFWRGGYYQPATGPYTAYVVRWNGFEWKRVAIPMHHPYDIIEAMAGGPHGQVWAVGYGSPTGGANADFAESMLWNGKQWRQEPTIQGNSTFLGVGFIPGGGAWAVGFFGFGGVLAARWTGKAWKPAPAPGVNPHVFLNAVAATSARNAWAVGSVFQPVTAATPTTVILHWDGSKWS